MQVTLAGSLLDRKPNDSQLTSVSISLSAFDGEVGISSIPIPDPGGADEVPPGRAVLVTEVATVLLDGIINSEGRERGPDKATGRQDTYSIEDANTFLYGFRVIADRPEETDYARIQWFFDTYLPAADTTMVLNTSTSTMVAASYASDGVADIMRDAIDLTGKTLFVHDKAAGGLCAHWHALTGGHTCGLSISDDPSAVNGVTVFAPQNPTRIREGRDLANDYLAYGAEGIGPVSVVDSTSISVYDADGRRHQRFASFPEAADLTTLTADAERLLATNKDPRETWTATIGPLDATALALIRVGDIITVTSEVMALAAEPQRIATLRLTVSAGTAPAPGLWDAELTLGAPVRGPGARSVTRPPVLPQPGFFQPAAACFADQFLRTVASGLGGGWTGSESAHIDVSVNGSAGVVFFDDPGTVPAFEGMTYTTNVPTQTGPYGAAAGFNFAVMPPGAHGGLVFYDAFGDFAVTCTIGNDGTGSVLLETPASSGSWLVTEWKPGYHPISVRVTPGVGVFCYVPISGEETAAISVADATVAGGTSEVGVSVQLTNMIGDWTVLFQSLIFDGCAPYKGQQVPLESVATADGATTGFQTSAPYWPGSLRVLVDRIDWTNEVTETDPTTGAFTFDTAPFDTDQIDAYYVAG